MMDVSGNNIKIVDIAPEEDGDYTFTRKAKNEAVISLAHSVSGYDKASESFHYGISHATHMFNAMSGFHHRDPGAVGAIFDNDKVTAEIICDGYHVHPAVLRTVFKYMGDRLAVISDSMSAGGLGEGDDFYLGGQKVSVKDGMAHLSDGTIAGSVTNLYDEICNLVKFGIPLEKAVKSATIIPAQIIGIDDITGSIKAGKKADIVVMDKKLNIAAVYH